MDNLKEIKLTYYQKNKEKLTKYSQTYYQKIKHKKYSSNENITLRFNVILEFL